MNRLKQLLLASALLLGTAAVTAAEPVNTLEKGFFGFGESGIAIRGYDTVAYFTRQQAMPGKPEYHHDWQGARWLFVSAEHRDLFAASPEAYAPRFGGYCAYGVAHGDLLKVEGDQWAVVEGRLYLNYDEKWMQRWQNDRETLIMMAEARYAELVGAD